MQVLRLQDFFLNFEEAVALFDFFAETAGDGRWDRLRVLDLWKCSINDIAMGQLAAAMEAGFGSALEELDLTTAPSFWPEYVHLCSYRQQSQVRMLNMIVLTQKSTGSMCKVTI